MKWMSLLVFGGLGLFALIAGIAWGLKRSELIWNGLQAEGVVVDNYKSVSASVEDEKARTGPKIAYYPVVEFKPEHGTTIRFRGSTGSGVPDYETGAVVRVVYRRENPAQVQILSFSQFWLGPLVVTIAGLLCFSMGTGAFFLIGQSDRSMQAAQELMRQQFPEAGSKR
jgi:hypothetical protein